MYGASGRCHGVCALETQAAAPSSCLAWLGRQPGFGSGAWEVRVATGRSGAKEGNPVSVPFPITQSPSRPDKQFGTRISNSGQELLLAPVPMCPCSRRDPWEHKQQKKKLHRLLEEQIQNIALELSNSRRSHFKFTDHTVRISGSNQFSKALVNRLASDNQ